MASSGLADYTSRTHRESTRMENLSQLEPLAHSPDSAAKRIGISTRAVFTAIANGDLPSFKIGKRRLIFDVEAQKFVQRKAAEARPA